MQAAHAQQAPDSDLSQRYERAAQLLPSSLRQLVSGVEVSVQWEREGHRLRYSVRAGRDWHRYEVDVDARVQRLLASPPSEEPAHPPEWSISPSGGWAVRADGADLVAINLGSGEERRLTSDGEEHFAYGRAPDAALHSLTTRRAGRPEPPVLWWAPDRDVFVTYRVDERELPALPYVVSIVGGETHQIPYLHEQRTAFPGSSNVPLAQLVAFDLERGARQDLRTPQPMIAYDKAPFGDITWTRDGQAILTVSEQRDFRRQAVNLTSLSDGAWREIAAVRAALPIRNPVTESGPDNTIFHYLERSQELVLYSEEDGWAHYYLIDARTGHRKRQLTRGHWVVHDIKYVDAASRRLFFTAGGRERGSDPYYSRLYSVSLDGGQPVLLTPEEAHHTVSFSPDGQYFVDTYSTVSQPQTTVLRARDGSLVMELQHADIGALLAQGWHMPERFSVLAADGRTRLYGTLFFPSDLDPARRYPIVDAIYAGPQSIWAPRMFLQDKQAAMGLAQLGFVVMLLDARGTPGRSQAFQDFAFAEGFGSAGIVADHAAAIMQLASRHAFIDADRVGIYGHSWGGYRAARAMFQFPEVFRVGVATSGSHDNFLYVFEHDRWFGSPQDYPQSYQLQSNLPLAPRLEGNLLLVHGDVDDNVHPANTLQLADALIRANRRFDMFIYPNRGHEIASDPYYVRLMWDYFVEHLLGETPPPNTALSAQ